MQNVKTYNKLVRDNILEIIESAGVKHTHHIGDIDEYKEKLIEKLLEEIEEFKIDRNEEEMADILEVIDAIIGAFGLERSLIQSIQEKKSLKNGKFDKRIILEKTYQE